MEYVEEEVVLPKVVKVVKKRSIGSKEVDAKAIGSDDVDVKAIGPEDVELQMRNLVTSDSLIKDLLNDNELKEEGERVKQMESIFERIKKDRLETIAAKNKYQEVIESVNDKFKFQKALRGLLRTIEPFDIDLFKELVVNY